MENNKKMIYLHNSYIDKLNSYEKEYKKISYRTLLDCYNINCILCNNIINIDEFLLDNMVVGKIYDDENDEYDEIYQYFIIDANEWDIENLKKYYDDELKIAYSEKLENYILLVDHFGTSWDYILTDITYTNNFEEFTEWQEKKYLEQVQDEK